MIKKHKDLLLSFFIPLILLLLLFFTWSLFYKDGNNVFISDLDAQYKSLFMYFKHHLFEGYSFHKGLGGSMIGTLSYYLMSPFNFILFLFSDTNLYIAILFILLFKLSTSGLTMYLYLKYHFPKSKKFLLFSTCYVLMGYNIAYFFNIMWLDAIYLLPLVALGIDKIIKEKKSFCYILFLALTIFINYYMGYMICIFSVLYFFYIYLLQDKKKREKIHIKKFIISSLLAGLLTSILTFPTLIELTHSIRSTVDVFNKFELLSPIKFLSNLFLGSHNQDDMLSVSRYYIYIGLFNFILVLLYFINSKISKKEKKYAGIMIFLFFISIFINYIDYIWHAFSIPHCFSGRYMFIICFFFLTLSFSSFEKIHYIKSKHLMMIAPTLPIVGILVLFKQFDYIKTYMIFVSVFLFFLYLLLLYIYITHKKYQKKFYFLLLFLTFAELFINAYFFTNDYQWSRKNAEIQLYKQNVKEVQKLKKEDSSFFRMENTYGISKNDSLYFDYYGVQTFLSTIDENQYDFFRDIGYTVHGNIIEYKKSFPVIDSLLGIKYILDIGKNVKYPKIDTFKQPMTKTLFYDLSTVEIQVLKNENALSLGTLVSKDLSTCQISLKNRDYLDYQNQILSCLLNKKVNVYEKMKVEQKDKQYIIKPNRKGSLYFYPNFKSQFLSDNEVLNMKLSDKNVGDFTNSSFIIQEYEQKDEIERELSITMNSSLLKKYQLYAYYFNKEEYNKVFHELKQNSLEMIEDKGSIFKGKVNVTKKKDYLFTTIPYDEGFKVYVDGKKVDYDKVMNTFIGIKLSEGEHIIEFKFIPKGFIIGGFITLITLLFTFLYLKREKNNSSLSL